ncbi:MAG: S8 family serine peptidase [Hyphomonadaceae bacterium]
MNSLTRCIFLAAFAVVLSTTVTTAAAKDEDRYDDRDDRDNSGPGSGDDREDRDDRDDGDRDDDDRDDRDDDRDERDNSGSGSGDDRDSADNDDDDDRSGGHGSREDDALYRQAGDPNFLAFDAALARAAEIARDDLGREYVRDEALMLGGRDDLDRAVEHGYALISERTLHNDGRIVARLHVPRRLSVDRAVERLSALAPTATITRNTIFRGAQTRSAPSSTAPTRARVPAPNAGLIGVIDTGADVSNLRSHVVALRAFGSDSYTPREHGTAVATIAVNNGARVQLADVFTVSANGQPAASVDAIVAAVDWMMESGVPVMNISVEGPDNRILSEILERAARRGFIVVAAAGNGGPRADPAFPGAFDTAVAVTAVDSNNRIYARANRGDYISFAALGVRVQVQLRDESRTVSGTSFAAPVVAARLAEAHRQPSTNGARAAIARLREQAVDLGQPGHDPIYGWGLVAPDPDRP